MAEASPYLEGTLQHQLGSFCLNTSFALTSPWSMLFGPSGSGKSTLLRLIAGLLRPDNGRLECFGVTFVDTSSGVFLSPGKRAVGLVMQQPALFPHMSVAGNVAFGLHGIAPGARSSRVDAMLELFEAAPLAQRRPAELSGGEQQRVALARALAPEPRLILLDEPFSALDCKLKDRILERLARWLAERQIPAVYVSHDPSEAFQTSAEVLVMHEGRITAQGPAAEVLTTERDRVLRHLRG